MKVFIVAGGTGGHVFPALAVAKEFEKEKAEIFWFGREGSLEHDICKKEGYKFYITEAKAFRGQNLFQKLIAIFYLFSSFIISLKLIRNIRPKFVFSSGNFISLAPGLSAFVLDVPLFIHEQNTIPGTSNKILSRFSKIVFEGFSGSFQLKGVKFVGNPVRENIIRYSGSTTTTKNKDKKINLLILGGSQGSIQLNEIVMEALRLIEDKTMWRILHQTGTDDINRLNTDYQSLDFEYSVQTFIENMGEAYREADLVIARAGAMTIAELLVMEKPSILLPLPWSTDNHQFYNAQYLKRLGAAQVIQSKKASISYLASLLIELTTDRKRLKDMSRSAKKYSLPNSSREIVKLINEYFK